MALWTPITLCRYRLATMSACGSSATKNTCANRENVVEDIMVGKKTKQKRKKILQKAEEKHLTRCDNNHLQVKVGNGNVTVRRTTSQQEPNPAHNNFCKLSCCSLKSHRHVYEAANLNSALAAVAHGLRNGRTLYQHQHLKGST